MENASKALIIAGAILLSISIIGIGMYIFQQASGAMGNVGLETEQVATYNEPFTRYDGDRVQGSQVIQLITLIRNHNVTHQQDPSENISITKTGTPSSQPQTTVIDAATTNSARQGIQAGQYYKVQLGYGPDGRIVNVDISASN